VKYRGCRPVQCILTVRVNVCKTKTESGYVLRSSDVHLSRPVYNALTGTAAVFNISRSQTIYHEVVKHSCVDGFANGHVRMGVGFARIRLACESMRIANPRHRCTVPTPHRKRLWHGDSYNIKKACESLSDSCESAWLANPCELRIRITET